MTIICGYSEAEERMRNNKEYKPKATRMDKAVAESIAEGNKSSVLMKNKNKYAMGGVVKERRGFYGE